METFKNNCEVYEPEMQAPIQPSLEEQIQEIYNSENENPEIDNILTQIARQVGGISTLERQYSDRQDFHDVSVGRLRELLRVSYELGKSYAQNKSITPAFEKTQDVYRWTYLELEIGNTVVEFGRFSNLDCNYEDIFKDKNFKVRHKLSGGQTLKYTCQFKNFKTAQNLYHHTNLTMQMISTLGFC